MTQPEHDPGLDGQRQAEAEAREAADADVRRLVRLALTGAAMGTFAGTATVIGAMLAVLQLQARTSTDEGTLVLLIAGGTLGGLAVGAASTWWILAPLGNWFRRGMLATVSAFATVLAMLLAFPVRGLFGSAGLLAFVLACLLIAFWLGRRARRLSA
ncbi:MAG TPA: hypothetical protein VFL88_04080 [Gemmatimonadales bacterium]|nr:hypothetical protein [Gemmatimonadales bacterium]